MKLKALLLGALILTLGVGVSSRIQAQTSQDLQINDTSSDYNQGYQDGQEALVNGGPSEPQNNNSQPYRDGYSDGYNNTVIEQNFSIIDVNDGEYCSDRGQQPISTNEQIDDQINGRGDFKIDLSTGETNCETN